jgi:adenine specific DNA methylase Mod
MRGPLSETGAAFFNVRGCNMLLLIDRISSKLDRKIVSMRIEGKGLIMRELFFGDNLDVLREHIKTKSVDLIYLGPPFNSKRDYNLLFKSPKCHVSDAQITAFDMLQNF